MQGSLSVTVTGRAADLSTLEEGFFLVPCMDRCISSPSFAVTGGAESLGLGYEYFHLELGAVSSAKGGI